MLENSANEVKEVKEVKEVNEELTHCLHNLLLWNLQKITYFSSRQNQSRGN